MSTLPSYRLEWVNVNNKDLTNYLISGLTGFIVCLVISIITGRREAWDSGMYFYLGIPLMCLVIFQMTSKNPERAWRWTLAMALGQSIAMTLKGGSLSLWPLSIIAMTICSVPQFLTGMVTAKIKIKKAN